MCYCTIRLPTNGSERIRPAPKSAQSAQADKTATKNDVVMAGRVLPASAYRANFAPVPKNRYHEVQNAMQPARSNSTIKLATAPDIRKEF